MSVCLSTFACEGNAAGVGAQCVSSFVTLVVVVVGGDCCNL